MSKTNEFTIEVKTNIGSELQMYSDAFDDLRRSLNGLSQPITSLSKNFDGLDKSLSKYNNTLEKATTQSHTFATTGDKVEEKVIKASNAFTSFFGVLKLMNGGFKEFAGAISGGIGLLIAILPEIINVVAGFIKGKDAVSAMTQNLKNLNDVMKAANQDAALETSRLKLLATAAADVNSSMKSRLESVKQLKNEYPKHLKNLRDEDFLNGQAKGKIDDLTKSITQNAKAKAALSKITEEANKILEANYMIEKINNANFNEKRRYDNDLARSGNSGYAKIRIKMYKEQSDERAAEAKEIQDKIQKDAEQRIAFLTKFAGGADKILQVTNNKKASDDFKESYEQQLQNQRTLLSQLDSEASDFAEKSKVIGAKIKQIKQKLARYSAVEEDGPTGSSIKNKINIAVNTSTPLPNKSKKTNGKSIPSPATEQLKAQSITLAQTVELNKKAYDEEMAVLNRHLEMKIISQEEYQQKSEALQNKYHLAIGTVIKTFQKNELEDTQKHFFEIINAESLAKLSAEAKQKSWTPDQKFEAEVLQIKAKYAMDVANFKGTEEQKQALAEEGQRKITELTQHYEQQRRDFAMQNAQQVSDAAFSILKNGMQAQSAARLKTLDTQKSAELNNSNLTATQRKAIEEKYKKKEAEEKVRAFKAEQRASILQAVINGALAITKVTAQAGLGAPFVIPGIIASTALQVATIAAQKAPKYAMGGLHYRSDGRGALLSGYSRADDTNAYLRSGEAVVVSEAMRNPWARNLVSAINVAHGGRDFSTSSYGNGFAVGGIFTDGGNANRYYNQPVHDAKELANTLAYQMINNFPPIYVDVKDVNNQQNILAQTVNRVNL